MIGVGPLSIHSIVIVLAVLAAWLAARAVARRLPDKRYRKAAGGMLLDAAFWGFLAARLVYIGRWWEEYSDAPMSMIAISDGGFSWWAGLPVAAAFVWWRTRPFRILRSPVLSGLIVGVAVWVAANGVLSLLLRSAAPLPDLQLMTLDERPVALSAYEGRPVVLNLWASWCPPCRREMPAFEQAQKTFPEIAFVMVNQGETARQAREFLEEEGLSLSDVLLDQASSAMRTLQSRGLPTTLFFDERGQMVDTHLGEITLPVLSSTVLRRFESSALRTTEKE